MHWLTLEKKIFPWNTCKKNNSKRVTIHLVISKNESTLKCSICIEMKIISSKADFNIGREPNIKPGKPWSARQRPGESAGSAWGQHSHLPGSLMAPRCHSTLPKELGSTLLRPAPSRMESGLNGKNLKSRSKNLTLENTFKVWCTLCGLVHMCVSQIDISCGKWVISILQECLILFTRVFFS